MKKAISGVITASILLMLISFACNSFNINKCNLFGIKPVIIASNSMQPTLNIGDFHLLYKSKDYNIGDIVAYEKDNKLILHRIIELSEDYVITQGDNNSTHDGIVFKQDILFEFLI